MGNWFPRSCPTHRRNASRSEKMNPIYLRFTASNVATEHNQGQSKHFVGQNNATLQRHRFSDSSLLQSHAPTKGVEIKNAISENFLEYHQALHRFCGPVAAIARLMSFPKGSGESPNIRHLNSGFREIRWEFEAAPLDPRN